MEGEGMVTKVAFGLSALIMCGMVGVYVYKFHYETEPKTTDKDTQTDGESNKSD